MVSDTTASAREYLKNTATYIVFAERPPFEYRMIVWNSAEGWAKFSVIRTRLAATILAVKPCPG